jgi:hypothetical protein
MKIFGRNQGTVNEKAHHIYEYVSIFHFHCDTEIGEKANIRDAQQFTF